MRIWPYYVFLATAALLASGCVPYRKDYTQGEASVCEVHRVKMVKTVVPVEYGLAAVPPRTAAMDKVRPTEFPHAADSVNPGCNVQRTREATIYTCPDCVRARRAWEEAYEANQH